MNFDKSEKILDIYDVDGYQSSYKNWVVWQLDHGTKGGRGARKLLAAFVGCQLSHIANVLNGDAHFSFEQAERVGSFFGLSMSELEFFVLVVQWNRAGTRELSALMQVQIASKRQQVLDARRNLKERVPIRKTLGSEEQAIYYSSWQYAAVHVLLSVSHFQTPEALMQTLAISRDRLTKVLEFLCQTGLAVYQGGRYEIGPQHLHLPSDSPFISRHHVNWRSFVAGRLEAAGGVDTRSLHYSSVVTVSEEDCDRVREILTRALSDAIGLIKESPEEKGAVLSIDWMSI